MNNIKKIAALAALALGTLGGAVHVHASGPATAAIDPPWSFGNQKTSTNVTSGDFVTFTLNYDGVSVNRIIDNMTAGATYHTDFNYTCDGGTQQSPEVNAGPFTGGNVQYFCNPFQALDKADTTVTVD